MFITYQPFKFPLQFDRESTIWTAVELALHTPVFLVSTTTEDDEATRTFMLDGTNELLEFSTREPAGRIAALHVLQPPRSSARKKWALVTMREILLQKAPPDGSRPSAVVRSVNGALYGGFPVAPLKGDPGPLLPLASLPA